MLDLNVSIKDDLFFGLKKLAKATKLPENKIVEYSLEQYFLSLKEDREDYKIAEKAWEEFENSAQETYSLDEVEKELGL